MKYGAEVDLALIDADLLVYRSAFSAEHNIHTLTWGDPTTNEKKSLPFEYKRDLNNFIKLNDIEEYDLSTEIEVEPLANAIHTVKKTISSILDATKPADTKFFLTSGDNFRHKLATIAKYKGHRDGQRRPKHYADIRKYLVKYYGAIECAGIEADDALADHQTDRTVLCSLDKDLLQVPGKHYNWIKDVKVLVSEETALRTLWMQVLTGDATDNIPGIYKVGPVTAKKWLSPCETEEEMRELCIDKWSEYLQKEPTLMGTAITFNVNGEDGSGTEEYMYDHWEKGPMTATAADIVEEIYQLVKVGKR